MILDLSSAEIITIQRNILEKKIELEKNPEFRGAFRLLVHSMQSLEIIFCSIEKDDIGRRKYLRSTIKSLIDEITERFEKKGVKFDFNELEFEKLDNEIARVQRQRAQSLVDIDYLNLFSLPTIKKPSRTQTMLGKIQSLREYAADELRNPWNKIEDAKEEALTLEAKLHERRAAQETEQENKRLSRLARNS